MKQILTKFCSENLNDTNRLLNVLLEKCNENGLTVLKYTQHKFHPQGYTAVILLAESHISIHTYPEDDIAYMDIFCCNNSINLETITKQIVENIEGNILTSKLMNR